MKLFAIYFDRKNPVFKGSDGKYWLGGSASILTPLIFVGRIKAMTTLSDIKKEIVEDKQNEYSKSILKNVSRFTVEEVKLTII